ncbi:MAG TPA: ECF transporter S component [Candidatus Limosilactobacillus gallistercoris]|nr:ECF transporter S component [Candidatus Limosilactobacillus gallistercoris]
MTRHQRIRRNTRRAIFMAIIIIQDLVPFFGNIPLGPLSITTLHVTVILAAITLGPGEGAIVGGTWGILTWVRAFVAPSSPLAPLVFTNPLVAIFPRIMIGLVAGYLFRLVARTHSQRWAAILAAGAGAITNTGLVLGMIYFFYRTPAVAHAYGVDVSHLLPALLAIMATNGLAELVLAIIVVPLVALPVLEVRRRLGQ